jgi:hypothetical protein
MRIGEMEIYDYARQLLEAHGDMAVIEAARRPATARKTVRAKRLKPGGTSRRP